MVNHSLFFINMQRYHLIEIGGVEVPFKFSVGVLKKHCNSLDISLSAFLKQLGEGDIDKTLGFYYDAMKAGYKAKGEKPLFDSIEDFEDNLDFSEIELISNSFSKVMPTHTKKK